MRGCLDVRAGDVYAVLAEPAHRECAVALAEAAYRAGASIVEIVYAEPSAHAARVRHAADEHLGAVPPWEILRLRALHEQQGAFTSILADAAEGTFAGLPPERVAADFAAGARRMRRFRRAAMAGRRRWVGISWPTRLWAERVYPELDRARPSAASRATCSISAASGPTIHPATRAGCSIATRSPSVPVRSRRWSRAGSGFAGPGTDLSFRLVPGTRWLGGCRENAWGILVTSNFPTEETFTSPDAAGTSGSFRCSRPLSFRGRVIDGIAGEFRRGRLVRLEASRDDDRDFLAAALDTDPGARRLGEVALVDRSSRIGLARRTYANTLIDENAAAHIAFGFAFQQTRIPDPATPGRRGLNRSDLHLDVMIGTDDFEATGWTADGREVPLLVDGTWQL